MCQAVHIFSELETFRSKEDFSLAMLQYIDIREAPFWNVLVLYMHWPNSFRPSPLWNGQTRKKCPKPSWQALTPPGQRGKKVPKTILASLYIPCSPPLLTGNAHMETTHFKKGLPLPNQELHNLTFSCQAALHLSQGFWLKQAESYDGKQWYEHNGMEWTSCLFARKGT